MLSVCSSLLSSFPSLFLYPSLSCGARHPPAQSGQEDVVGSLQYMGGGRCLEASRDRGCLSLGLLFASLATVLAHEFLCCLGLAPLLFQSCAWSGKRTSPWHLGGHAMRQVQRLTQAHTARPLLAHSLVLPGSWG